LFSSVTKSFSSGNAYQFETVEDKSSGQFPPLQVFLLVFFVVFCNIAYVGCMLLILNDFTAFDFCQFPKLLEKSRYFIDGIS